MRSKGIRIKCWTCGSFMNVFATEDGKAAGYLCAQCPKCLEKILNGIGKSDDATDVQMGR